MAACTFAVCTADTGATPNTSGAFTPASSDLLVVMVQAASSVDTGVGALTSSVGGFTFSLVGTDVAGATDTIYCYVSDALVSSATSQTVTWTPVSDAATGTVIAVYRVSGITRTGASAIRQSDGNHNGSSTNPTVTFPAACLTGNPTILALINASNPAGVDPPTGWTENAAGDVGYNSPTAGLEICARDSGYTGTGPGWATNSATAWATFGVEVDTSAAGVTRDPGLGAATLAGLAPSMDKGIGPGLGALTLAGTVSVVDRGMPMQVSALTVSGLAPSMDKGIGPGLGTLAITGLSAELTRIVSVGAGTATFAGLAPSAVVGPIINAGLGALTATGLAPALGFTIPDGIGSAALAGLAPSLVIDRSRFPGVGTATLAGLAPSLSLTIPLPAGSLTFGGLAPTISVGAPAVGGGGGPGLLVILGLNLEVSNYTISPPPAVLQFSTSSILTFGAGYSYSIPVGAITTTGRAPVITDSSSNQAPVMQQPTAMAFAGLAPTVVAGKKITFPFDTDAQGFVGTPGPGTTMTYAVGTGHPPGSLRSDTSGFNRLDDNTWTLSTDWQSLGLPADVVVTGISIASAETRALVSTNATGTFKSVTLTPTGFGPIQIAPSRPFTAAEANWTVGSGAGAVNREISSNGSLTITSGSLVNTDASGTPDVALFLDNIEFTVTYVSARSVSPGAATVSFTGLAPTVVALAAVSRSPAQAALSIQGQGPTVQVASTATGGGGGPGLLMALALNLEPRALGPANLAITGYAPTVVRPITLGGSDDLISGSATAVGTGNIVVVGGSTIETPAVGTLAITGLVPALVLSGNRLVTMPVTALTITRFVPTLGIDYLFQPGAGSVHFDGLGPSVEPSYVVTPFSGAMQIVGRVPIALTSLTIQVGVGSLVATGLQPNPQRTVTSGPFAGVATFTGLQPFVSASDSRRFDPLVGSATFAGLAPVANQSHVRTPGLGTVTIQGLGPTVIGTTTAEIESPNVGSVAITGLAPTVLVSVQVPVGVGAVSITTLAPTIATTVPFAVPEGSATITTYAPLLQLAKWVGSGSAASEPATMTSAAELIRHGSGDLQAQPPLLFLGTGEHGPTTTADLQSGPASLHGEILSVTASLQSQRATLKARARYIRFKPHKPPRPEKMNRYNVTLKPNKRMRIRNPNRRRPNK